MMVIMSLITTKIWSLPKENSYSKIAYTYTFAVRYIKGRKMRHPVTVRLKKYNKDITKV